jgi:hypothetical protein
MLLRRQWLATAAFIVLGIGLTANSQLGQPAISILYGVVSLLLVPVCLLRFGALALVVLGFLSNLLPGTPLTTDLSAWYSGPTVLAIAVILALTAYAFHTAVAGRPLFKGGFLEPD